MLRYHCKACGRKTTLDSLIEVGYSHNNRPIRICKPFFVNSTPYKCNNQKWPDMYKKRLLKA